MIKYTIWQITNDAPYMFCDYKTAVQKGFKRSDYQCVYEGELKPGENLDTLYVKFNISHPEGFKGHSLSVSDIIVLTVEGKNKTFYIDTFGFARVTNFCTETEILQKESGK